MQLNQAAILSKNIWKPDWNVLFSNLSSVWMQFHSCYWTILRRVQANLLSIQIDKYENITALLTWSWHRKQFRRKADNFLKTCPVIDHLKSKHFCFLDPHHILLIWSRYPRPPTILPVTMKEERTFWGPSPVPRANSARKKTTLVTWSRVTSWPIESRISPRLGESHKSSVREISVQGEGDGASCAVVNQPKNVFHV